MRKYHTVRNFPGFQPLSQEYPGIRTGHLSHPGQGSFPSCAPCPSDSPFYGSVLRYWCSPLSQTCLQRMRRSEHLIYSVVVMRIFLRQRSALFIVWRCSADSIAYNFWYSDMSSILIPLCVLHYSLSDPVYRQDKICKILFYDRSWHSEDHTRDSSSAITFPPAFLRFLLPTQTVRTHACEYHTKRVTP